MLIKVVPQKMFTRDRPKIVMAIRATKSTLKVRNVVSFYSKEAITAGNGNDLTSNYLSKKCVLTKIPTDIARTSNNVVLKSVINLNIKNRSNPTTKIKHKISIIFSMYPILQ